MSYRICIPIQNRKANQCSTCKIHQSVSYYMIPTVTYTWNSSLSHNFSIITLKFYAYQLTVIYNYNTLIIPKRTMQYLDYSDGLVFLCSKKLPEDGTLVKKYVGV
jgi:hypothetical protein